MAWNDYVLVVPKLLARRYLAYEDQSLHPGGRKMKKELKKRYPRVNDGYVIELETTYDRDRAEELAERLLSKANKVTQYFNLPPHKIEEVKIVQRRTVEFGAFCRFMLEVITCPFHGAMDQEDR